MVWPQFAITCIWNFPCICPTARSLSNLSTPEERDASWWDVRVMNASYHLELIARYTIPMHDWLTKSLPQTLRETIVSTVLTVVKLIYEWSTLRLISTASFPEFGWSHTVWDRILSSTENCSMIWGVWFPANIQMSNKSLTRAAKQLNLNTSDYLFFLYNVLNMSEAVQLWLKR